MTGVDPQSAPVADPPPVAAMPQTPAADPLPTPAVAAGDDATNPPTNVATPDPAAAEPPADPITEAPVAAEPVMEDPPAGTMDPTTDPVATDMPADMPTMDPPPTMDPVPSADPAPAMDPAPAGTNKPISFSDVFSGPSQCTSGSTFIGEEGETMRPGEACNSCHQSQGEGPIYTIAGTLYPTGKEPDDCQGVDGSSGAVVVITDANDMVYELTPNRSGNFTLRANIALPYHAMVVTDTAIRPMVAGQTVGDCNSCHTEEGSQDAPGRIALP
jgi:hypothetical protein